MVPPLESRGGLNHEQKCIPAYIRRRIHQCNSIGYAQSHLDLPQRSPSKQKSTMHDGSYGPTPSQSNADPPAQPCSPGT